MLDLSGAATGDRIPPKNNFAGAAGLTFLEVSEEQASACSPFCSGCDGQRADGAEFIHELATLYFTAISLITGDIGILRSTIHHRIDDQQG